MTQKCIDTQEPKTGRMLLEDDSVINLANILTNILNGVTPIPTLLNGSLANQIGSQNVTTSGTRAQMPTIPCREIFIKAKRGNAGYIYIGDNSVSATIFGNDLAANESMTIQVANLNQLYIDASVNGEGVTYIAI